MNQFNSTLLIVQQGHVLKPDGASLNDLHANLIVPGNEVSEGAGDGVSVAVSILPCSIMWMPSRLAGSEHPDTIEAVAVGAVVVETAHGSPGWAVAAGS